MHRAGFVCYEFHYAVNCDGFDPIEQVLPDFQL